MHKIKRAVAIPFPGSEIYSRVPRRYSKAFIHSKTKPMIPTKRMITFIVFRIFNLIIESHTIL